MNEVEMQVFAVYLVEYPDEGSTHIVAAGQTEAIARMRKDVGDDDHEDEYAAVRVYGPASEAACNAWAEGWGEGYEAAEKVSASSASRTPSAKGRLVRDQDGDEITCNASLAHNDPSECQDAATWHCTGCECWRCDAHACECGTDPPESK